MQGAPQLFHPSWNTETVEWLDKEWKGQNAASLESEVPKSSGKIKVFSRYYFADTPPSMQMYLEIIESLDDLFVFCVLASYKYLRIFGPSRLDSPGH